MKYDKDINHIRHLLDKYYSAETTPDEEEMIESFLSDTDYIDIPENMEADARLFSIMRATHPLPSECDVPDDLIEKLNGIVEEPLTSPSHSGSRRIFKLLKYSGIAAAACITWAIVTLLPSPKHNESTMPEYHIAEVTEADDGILIINKSPADKKSFGESTIDRPSLPDAAPKRRVSSAHTKASQQTGTEYSDGFIEITDPEEAKKIAIEIGRLLAFNADKTNDAIAHISNSIDSYKEITKNILQ